MRIACTIEWLGHKAGWHAAAEYRGKPVTVTQQKSFALARKRLRSALEAAGVPKPDLQITARMPKSLEQDVTRYRELATLIPDLAAELEALKIKIAQRMCNELNFSEREAGLWLGVSGAHISAKLRALTIDTGEFVRPARNGDHTDAADDEDALPRGPECTKRPLSSR